MTPSANRRATIAKRNYRYADRLGVTLNHPLSYSSDVTRHRLKVVMPETVTGTSLRVDETWYIRLEGHGGNPVRVDGPSSLLAALPDGEAIIAQGHLSHTPSGLADTFHMRAFSLLISRAPPSAPAAEADTGVEDDDSDEVVRKKLIEEELKKPNPDWKVIEAASRSAVDSDPDSVRFSVDAAHIQRLGEELVSKQETALSELIKNAFDADATRVSLEFKNQGTAGGTLTISDDGSGMTEDVIRSSWMRISTTAKDEQPVSPIYQRVRAGRKGIGRFSVQRLGRQLRFRTRPAGQTVGFEVHFSWDEAFLPGVSLADVFSRIQRFDKPAEEHGTSLEVLDLRDAWSPAAIDRVWKAIVLLQTPFPLAKPGSGKTRDPGFQVVIDDVSRDQRSELFSIEKSFLNQALATITAEIHKDGTASVRVVSDKTDVDDTATHPRKFLLTGPTDFEARYFVFEAGKLPGMSRAQASAFSRDFGGIRIYRNGFRVQPYGEPNDDWLRLAFDTGRRNLLVPANNSNFFGHVSLTSEVNPLFEETSSREGLIENAAFLELREFVRWAAEWAAIRMASARKRKTSAGEKDFVSTYRKPSEVVHAILDRRTGDGGGSGPGGGAEEDLEDVLRAAEDYERKVEADRAAAIEYEEMLRILASLGLSISVFGHEINGAERGLVANLAVLSDLIKEIQDDPLRVDFEDHADELDASANRLFDIGSYIGSLMSQTESRELHDLSVIGAIERFTRQFSAYMAKQNVSFVVDVQPRNLRTSPMHGSELDSVLLNFLTNSIKSMKRAKVSGRHVRIEARKVDDRVVIAFEDNGSGIPEDIRDRIFDPFFTTTLGSEEDGVAGPGTGLGLKIVSDIAESYGGEVEVTEPSDGYTCRIEFSVLAQKDEAN